jgi:hypothetical protein
VSITLPSRPPWVVLTLDSVPPALRLSVPARLGPPDPLRAEVDTGATQVSAAFTDSMGLVHPVGAQPQRPGLWQVLMGTVGLSTGPGVLRVLARSAAGLVAEAVAEVVIERARVFEVSTEVLGAFEVLNAHRRAFGTQTESVGAFTAQATSRRGDG